MLKLIVPRKLMSPVALSIMEGKVAADAVATREHLAAALEIADAVIAVRLSSAGFG